MYHSTIELRSSYSHETYNQAKDEIFTLVFLGTQFSWQLDVRLKGVPSQLSLEACVLEQVEFSRN